LPNINKSQGNANQNQNCQVAYYKNKDELTGYEELGAVLLC
jgi:hypothetical protein